MKIHKITPHMIDVFLDFDTTTTGYEPSCWLRLIKPKGQATWKQITGIKLPSYKYQTIIKELPTSL